MKMILAMIMTHYVNGKAMNTENLLSEPFFISPFFSLNILSLAFFYNKILCHSLSETTQSWIYMV